MHKILSQLLLLTRGYEGGITWNGKCFPFGRWWRPSWRNWQRPPLPPDPAVQPGSRRGPLYADQSLTTQLLINLIGNSIRYGRERGKVVVRASDPNPVHLHRLR